MSELENCTLDDDHCDFYSEPGGCIGNGCIYYAKEERKMSMQLKAKIYSGLLVLIVFGTFWLLIYALSLVIGGK